MYAFLYGQRVKILVENRLVQRIKFPDGKVVSRGKRVPKSCPLTEDERKIYVRYGYDVLINTIMYSRSLTYAEAQELLSPWVEFQ